MIAKVAQMVGPELLKEFAFVGGCTTALLLTDEFTREMVRHTDDVDLIVHVVGRIQWAELQDQLRKRGFKDDMADEGPICAMKLGELRVDFMPDDPSILGFSNKWYADALATATNYQLASDVTIRLVAPPYFVATKLEAYLGRGNGDALGSSDIEDILTLFDGRASLLDELAQADPELQRYVAQQIDHLLHAHHFDYAVGSAAAGDQGRERRLFQLLEKASRIK